MVTSTVGPKMPSVVIVISVLIAAAHPAPAQDTNAVADAIRHIQTDDPDPAPENRMKYVNIIEHEHAVEAIPVLEAYYDRTTDADIKAEVAFALVHLGDKKNIYQDYVAADAIKRVQRNDLGVGPVEAMSYVDRIANANPTEGVSVLEDYFKRTTDRDIKAGVASALVRMGDKNESYWTYLRGIPLLRKALSSPNLLVSSLAASGLAQANDTASIPLIIEACKRWPRGMAHFLADSLLFFDDPQAQSTYQLYFPDVNVSEARAGREGVFAGIPRHSKQ